MRWESNALAHYGIKGQQWGIRRFQNLDGSLTADGRLRYYSKLRKEEDVKKEVESRISDENPDVKNVQSLSAQVRKISKKRDQIYSDYYQKLTLSDKQKKGLEKVLDSWYGAPLNKDQKEEYDQSVRDLISEEINPYDAQGNTSSNVRKIEKQYDEKSEEYYKALHNFTSKLMNDYADTEVYTTKKGFLGLNIIDKRTDGKEFINKLINSRDLLVKLGGYDQHNGYDIPIGIYRYDSYQKADKIYDQAIKRLAKEFSFEWYNRQKKNG